MQGAPSYATKFKKQHQIQHTFCRVKRRMQGIDSQLREVQWGDQQSEKILENLTMEIGDTDDKMQKTSDLQLLCLTLDTNSS